MDYGSIPPEKLNPPAIVWDIRELEKQADPLPIEEFHENPPRTWTLIKNAYRFFRRGPNSAHLSPEEYMKSVTQDYGWTMKLFYRHELTPPSDAIPKLRGKQVLHILNHISLFDVAYVPYNLRKLGMGNVALVARDNMTRIPVMGKIFNECPLILIPFDGPDKQTVRQAHENLEAQRGIVLWAEGTRSRDGELKEFKEGAIRVIKRYADRHHKEILVSPEALIYSSIVEKPFFRIADFFKSHYNAKWGRTGYYLTDLAAFTTHALRHATYQKEQGISIHAFSEPFDIRDCRDEAEVCERAHKQISQKKRYYEERTRDWDLKIPPAKQRDSLEDKLDEIPQVRTRV